MLAWIRGKYDGGAIPYRWFLVPYRVISDTYGVFVYDADADFVRGWPASLDYPIPRLAKRRDGDAAQGRDALRLPDRTGLRRPPQGRAADAPADHRDAIGGRG